MSCDSNDNELKLTKEYKYLLSYIRPLIDHLNKSKDVQLCLLWLSKLEQCEKWERNYRNKILYELCRQVKANCLKPPFSNSPPSGPLRNVICGEFIKDQKGADWNTNEGSGDGTTEEAMSSSSRESYDSLKCSRDCHTLPLPWKGDHHNNSNLSSKSKEATKPSKELTDHSECFAIQKAYHERAQSDQMVIERYQDIIKSLVSQQLKADLSPSRLKKLQSTYETKIAELMHSNKGIQEENNMLRRKIERVSDDLDRLEDLKRENEDLRKQIIDLDAAKCELESQHKKSEDEKIATLTDLISKLNESDKKLKETEKRLKALEKQHEADIDKLEAQVQKRVHQEDIHEVEKKHFVKISALGSLLEGKDVEINNLKEQMTDQSNHFKQEMGRMKKELKENENFQKEKKKLKILKSKARKLERIQDHMTMLFQSQLQQILAKKDFYIASLEMQLKMNNESGGNNSNADFQSTLNEKICSLESKYRKILKDSEKQSLKRRQLDLQKIHTLEKHLLLLGGVIEDYESTSNHLKTKSVTSGTASSEDTGHSNTFKC